MAKPRNTRITIHGLTVDEYDAFTEASSDLERSVSAQARVLIRAFLKTTAPAADTDRA